VVRCHPGRRGGTGGGRAGRTRLVSHDGQRARTVSGFRQLRLHLGNLAVCLCRRLETTTPTCYNIEDTMTERIVAKRSVAPGFFGPSDDIPLPPVCSHLHQLPWNNSGLFPVSGNPVQRPEKHGGGSINNLWFVVAKGSIHERDPKF
jgi:hypothetical protein